MIPLKAGCCESDSVLVPPCLRTHQWVLVASAVLGYRKLTWKEALDSVVSHLDLVQAFLP